MTIDTRARRAADGVRASAQGVNPTTQLADLKREARNRRRAGAILSAAVVVVVLAGGGWFATRNAAPERPVVPTEKTVDMKAQAVVRGFHEALAAFDPEKATSYLAADADLTDLTGGAGHAADLRQYLAWLDAVGYKQTLGACTQLSSSTQSVSLRCAFGFQALRSDELGLGPYRGSDFVVVRDGKIVAASRLWIIDLFSPQMWEPFARWDSTAYPKDAAIMYADAHLSEPRLTGASVRLWERRTREYVAAPAGYSARTAAICAAAHQRASALGEPVYSSSWGRVLDEALVDLRSVAPPASVRSRYEHAYALLDELAARWSRGASSVQVIHQVESSGLGLEECTFHGPR